VIASGSIPAAINLDRWMKRLLHEPSSWMNPYPRAPFGPNQCYHKKRLLHEIAPSKASIAVLLNPNGAMAHVELNEAQAAAQTLGRRIHAVNIDSARAFDEASSVIADLRPAGLLVTTDPLLTNRAHDVFGLAERLNIPANYPLRAFSEAGGLMSYGASLHDAYWQVGRYLARIIKGEQAAELPVVQPTKFELVINLKTAKALGLEVPPTLLARADEVIE
jgi:putative ABC transport system substrate-binding protein